MELRDIPFPERSLAVRQACVRLCGQLAWAALHEVPLPNGRRADILALLPDGRFACIEIKSGPRDFLTDQKWPEYRDYCDLLFFAVDDCFPDALLPTETGMIVTCEGEAAMIRNAPEHKLAPARRRSLMHIFATLAAQRLMLRDYPAEAQALRSALRVE